MTMTYGLFSPVIPGLLYVLRINMALRNWLFFSQIIGYLLGFVMSLCITVPMFLHEHDFKGYCMLFSKVELDENNSMLLVKSWSNPAYCNYVLVTGISVNIICCVQIYRFLMFLYKGTDSSFLSTFFEAIVCIILTAAAVSAAIIVSLGFESWCDTILDSSISCGDAAGLDVKSYNISTSGFFIQVNVIQFGTWAVFATCVGLAVLSSLKVGRYHQEESSQEVARHRDRLLTESRSRTSSSLPGRSTPLLLET